MDEVLRMMDALVALEYELPSLVGEANWPVFEAELNHLMRQARQEPERIPELGDQIRQLVAGHPDVQQRVGVLRGDHALDPGEVAAATAAEEGRPQHSRPDHRPAPGRRAQASVPDDRLPPQ